MGCLVIIAAVALVYLPVGPMDSHAVGLLLILVGLAIGERPSK